MHYFLDHALLLVTWAKSRNDCLQLQSHHNCTQSSVIRAIAYLLSFVGCTVPMTCCAVFKCPYVLFCFASSFSRSLLVILLFTILLRTNEEPLNVQNSAVKRYVRLFKSFVLISACVMRLSS